MQNKTTQTLHQTGSHCYRFTNITRTSCAYLGVAETEDVLVTARNLLKKKTEMHGPAFIVLVDSESVACGNTRSLRRVLQGCGVDKERFVLFRNLNGGATINLDSPQKLSAEL